MPPTAPPTPAPKPRPLRWPETVAVLVLAAALGFWANRKAGSNGEYDSLRAEVAELQGQVESLQATNRDVTLLLVKTSSELDAARGHRR